MLDYIYTHMHTLSVHLPWTEEVFVMQGHGNDVDCIEPAMVNFQIGVRALQISCGFNHTGAIVEYT